MNEAVYRFVLMLREVQRDGLELEHFAMRGTTRRSTMPLTAFVYQFVMYNTLYSIDWPRSLERRTVVQIRELKELAKQAEFEEYMKQLATPRPQVLQECFGKLARKDLSGDWAKVTPDPYIDEAMGRRFFSSLGELAAIGGQKDLDLDRTFALIGTCRWFVNRVRNNIFHGTKTLGQVEDEGQRSRIEIYRLFLECLVSSFFALWDAACFEDAL